MPNDVYDVVYAVGSGPWQTRHQNLRTYRFTHLDTFFVYAAKGLSLAEAAAEARRLNEATGYR